MKNYFKPFIHFSPDAAGSGASGTGDDVAAATAVAATSAALETANQPENFKGLAAEWQGRSAGWQNKYQAEQIERKNAETRLAVLEEKHAKVTGEHLTVAEQLKSLQEKESLTQTELGTTNAKLDRLSIITSEFPSLIPFMSKNLLPDGTGEELRTKLTAFAGTISTLIGLSTEEAAKLLAEGATPPPPADEAAKDSPFKQAMTALKAGNQPEYDRLMSEHYKSQKP